jgi:hypothetical protein
MSMIACDIQPIQNLRVLKYHGDSDEAKKKEWGKHWISVGFDGMYLVIITFLSTLPSTAKHANNPKQTD